MNDAKQLVLFQNIPLSDAGALRQALEALQGFCGKPSLALRRDQPIDEKLP